MRVPRAESTSWIAVLLSVIVLTAGCGLEFTPTQDTMFTPKQLGAADRAIAAARSSGKAAQCPDAFQAAEKQQTQMYFYYRACNTAEAIATANDAIAKANALCPARVQAPPPPAPPPPPPPPPPAPPTATISASPSSVQQGACTTLSWSSTNATGATIDPAPGRVAPNGSQQVCPPSTTEYAMVATGPGGSARASTSVSVTQPPPPPPPPPAPKVIDKLTIHVNFDFDKYKIRSADLQELQKALDFIKRYPGSKVSLEGHTDSIGTVAYNQKLSERRAAAVKSWLVDHGVDGSRLQTSGYGKSRPIADNSTPQGRFENRRVEILILSE